MSASAALTRAWRVIQALSGHSLSGVRLGEVAGVVQQSSPTTLRDLQALESLGLAERLADKPDRWRLTPRLVQLALAHQRELAREEQRLDEFRNRYSRSPY